MINTPRLIRQAKHLLKTTHNPETAYNEIAKGFKDKGMLDYVQAQEKLKELKL